MDKVAKLRNTL